MNQFFDFFVFKLPKRIQTQQTVVRKEIPCTVNRYAFSPNSDLVQTTAMFILLIIKKEDEITWPFSGVILPQFWGRRPNNFPILLGKCVWEFDEWIQFFGYFRISFSMCLFFVFNANRVSRSVERKQAWCTCKQIRFVPNSDLAVFTSLRISKQERNTWHHWDMTIFWRNFTPNPSERH